MDKYITYKSENDIDEYHKELYNEMFNKINPNIISEGFFKESDGKNRICKFVPISNIIYIIKENILDDYISPVTIYKPEEKKIFTDKLKIIENLIKKPHLACGIFADYCSYYRIYYLKYGKNILFWTSFIIKKLIIRDNFKFNNSVFYDIINNIYDNLDKIKLFEYVDRSHIKLKPSYLQFIHNEIYNSNLRNNPLFFSNDKLIYTFLSEFNNNYRVVKQINKLFFDEDLKMYYIDIGLENLSIDLLFGITISSPELFYKIEVVYFTVNDKYITNDNYLLYPLKICRRSIENMIYIPITFLPYPKCVVESNKEKIFIKFKDDFVPDKNLIYIYGQNCHKRNLLFKMLYIYLQFDHITIKNNDVYRD